MLCFHLSKSDKRVPEHVRGQMNPPSVQVSAASHTKPAT